MTEAIPPVPVNMTVDRYGSIADLLRLALTEHLIDGSQPYVRSLSVGATCAAAGLLPEDAVVQRCVTTDSSVTLLARLGDVTIHITTSSRSTQVDVAAATHDRANEVAADIRARVPSPRSGMVSARIWHQVVGRNPDCADRSIEAPRWDDIAVNYPVGVRSQLDRIVALDRPFASGKLVLWHGPPGTGKTTAVRALMRAWEPWCQTQYIADPEVFFGQPSYIAHVLGTAPTATTGPTLNRAGEPEAVWRLVVAEDTDEYLRATAKRDAGAALGRLLNLADGILGQGRNVLVLLTTNEEVTRLHPALVRPGRCLTSVDFTKFDRAEASAWLRRPVSHPMTLAELLEARGDISQLGTRTDTVGTTGQYL